MLSNFELKFDFLERLKKQVRENGNKVRDDDKYLIWQKKLARIQKEEYSSCQYSYYTEEKLAFKTDLEAKSTKKSTATAVRQFRCWFEGKQNRELQLPLELHKITKKEAPNC